MGVARQHLHTVTSLLSPHSALSDVSINCHDACCYRRLLDATRVISGTVLAIHAKAVHCQVTRSVNGPGRARQPYRWSQSVPPTRDSADDLPHIETKTHACAISADLPESQHTLRYAARSRASPRPSLDYGTKATSHGTVHPRAALSPRRGAEEGDLGSGLALCRTLQC
jgi:hypothetical protein